MNCQINERAPNYSTGLSNTEQSPVKMDAAEHFLKSENINNSDVKSNIDLKPVDIAPGIIDQAGREVVDVYWITKYYAIYRWRKCTTEKTFFGLKDKPSATYDITVDFGDEKEHHKTFALIGPDLSRISALQKGSLSSRDAINCEIARCISLALESQVDEARGIINALQERLQAIRNTEDRSWYALLLTIFTALMIAIAVIFRSFLPETPELFPQLPLVLMFGAMGGYFSVLTKINRLCIDPEASRIIMAISAMTRIIVASIGSFATYTFMLSVFGKTFINSQLLTEGGIPTICVFAFLAGFSENFVPGLFRALEHGSNRSSNSKQGIDGTVSLPVPTEVVQMRRQRREI
jgi:hypothetical protein